MAKIDHLLPQAAEIRDAMQEGENTALRVGTMFVDLIQALEKILSSDDESKAAALNAIRQEIVIEASTRAAVDSRIEHKCDSLRADFGTEASERAGADNELRAAIRLLEHALDESEDGTFAQSTNEDIRELWSKISQLVSDLDYTRNDIDALTPIEVESEEAMAGLIASGEIDDNRMYYVPESD